MGEHEVARPAVFLDRDGVLNKSIIRDGKPFPPHEVAEFDLYDDVRDGCARLAAAGYPLVVVTNQPDPARGTQKREVVEAMNQKMIEWLPQIVHVEVCWHAGSEYGDDCECRKPRPGMLLDSARLLNLDLGRSFMVGDRWRDIDAGYAAGCRTVFIDRGYSEKLRQQPDWIVKSFGEAVDVILM